VPATEKEKSNFLLDSLPGVVETHCAVSGGTMFIIWWIIVGLIAGWITGKIMKGSGYGPIMDIIVGIIGAFIGGFLMRHIFGGTGQGGMIYTIIVAVIGAVILTFIIRLISKGKS
jgi:uncharacterized membrane protein YeaQ/YmgE (transglycosylase-associated protein family)